MSRILVVDDDPVSVLFIRQSLEAGGHEVCATSDPAAAAALAEEFRPDAVVLDVIMPRLSGFDVLERLKEGRRTQSTPVVFLSSRTGSEDRVKGLRSGAEDYIGKPFEPEELLVRLERLIEADQQTRDLAGSLEVYSLADLLQILQRDRQSGSLVIEGAEGGGRIELVAGSVTSCSAGHLTGAEALLDLFALENGRFRLEQGAAEDPVDVAGGQPISVQSLLLESAWLQDELSQVNLPEPQSILSLGPEATPEIPPDAEGRQLPRLRSLLAEQGPMTVSDLAAASRLSTSRFQLALARSLQLGLVEVDTAPTPQLHDVVGQFLASGAERGFCRRPQYLFLLGPEDATSRMDRSMGPAEPETIRSDTAERNWIFPFGRVLRIEHPEGLLVVRRQTLSGSLTSETLTALAIASGIALWDCPEAADVINRLSDHSRDKVGMLVGSDGRGDDEITLCAPTHWKIPTRAPRSLAELLAGLIEPDSLRVGTLDYEGSKGQGASSVGLFGE